MILHPRHSKEPDNDIAWVGHDSSQSKKTLLHSQLSKVLEAVDQISTWTRHGGVLLTLHP